MSAIDAMLHHERNIAAPRAAVIRADGVLLLGPLEAPEAEQPAAQSYPQSLILQVLSSESYPPSLILRVLSSKSYPQSLILRVSTPTKESLDKNLYFLPKPIGSDGLQTSNL
ncbi:hypothetical protein EYF80_050976 [Liparis tanakae]|uniref:Uncharacterized protein n=1 Tax=Liparis tanakae TaxID=230148 RepID=A0A4Z2FCE2_9TELE|nr:hypothetical protein EYF80_050976 [Liparis tanakae]